MNYKKIYDQLVEKCKVRGLDKSVLEGYFEKHHIVPRCMGGDDTTRYLAAGTYYLKLTSLSGTSVGRFAIAWEERPS